MLAAGRKPRLRKSSGPRVRDGNAEAIIQASIVQWIRTVSPQLVCFAVPNGGYREKAEAARLKWTGVLAGIPDLVVVGHDGRCWFLEVKAPGGVQSDAQLAIAFRFAGLRVPFAVVRSIDDVRCAFAIWGIATREAWPLPPGAPR